MIKPRNVYILKEYNLTVGVLSNIQHASIWSGLGINRSYIPTAFDSPMLLKAIEKEQEKKESEKKN